MKRIAIIGTVGVPGRYGGFETLAHQLVNHLSKDYDLKVYCSTRAYSKEERSKYFKGARLFYIPFNANGIQSIIYDFISIIHSLFVADTLVVLGVSGGLLFPFVRLFTRKRLIVNIDGLEWRREKWNRFAKKFLKFSERVAVRWSHADITDNEAIKRYTSFHYRTLSNLIEYGGDHVMTINASEADSNKYPFIHGPYAFKVARIEPENNIHLVLEAFAGLKQKLVVVGNWENSEYGTSLKKRFSGYSHIVLLDPIYDQRELDVLRSNCHVYIHGHSAGGTNPSLVEAMNLKLPVIAYDCSYNQATTEERALFFSTVDELADIITTVSIKDLMSNAEMMYEIARRRYTWAVISMKYSNLIEAFEFRYKKQTIWSQLSQVDRSVLLKKGMAHLQDPKPYYEER